MSQQFYNAMIDIVAMPYYKNDHARSGTTVAGHEAAVALRFNSAGFASVARSQFPKLTAGVLKTWAVTHNDTALRTAVTGLLPGSYILQPAGSQSFPDILVLDFNNRFVAVECKSGKGECPMWNDNVPKPNAVYVLSSGKQNATTVFMGCDVISPAEQAIMDQQEAAVAQVVARYTKQLQAIDVFGRGWIQKSRKQHFQGGGKVKTNYFTHASRAQCEANVLKYVKQ